MSRDEQFNSQFRQFLELLDEDPKRPGLQQTPQRVLESMLYLTRGNREDISEILEGGIFTEDLTDHNDVVEVLDIEFVSMCEHHLLPFFGHAHVAYLPGNKIIGLSKIARIVDHFAARLQVQERMTAQIADCLADHLGARGVKVAICATHLCMVARGVKKQDSYVVTTAERGISGKDIELHINRRS
ncbi:MAG: GTP cyclohydrolase I FolE [Myxococcota bacterium]|jgi:GTP cyclohydrolase I|nr:GTP cyclohydrolase I FolE [Myxococcota bacterium]MBP8970132.1 GTP cyclohydrolase I FolE [Myxococcota bacterium]